jgi:hypothetical protein
MKVARTSEGLPHVNRLAIRRVKILFQLHPGRHGEPATRGIAGVEYVVRVDGRVVDRGTTDAEGALIVWVPAGQSVVLEALGTSYAVEPIDYLDDVNQVKGYQARLSLLGYELGAIDGDHKMKTELAMMNFVADQGLDPDKKLSAGERKRLVEELGE